MRFLPPALPPLLLILLTALAASCGGGGGGGRSGYPSQPYGYGSGYGSGPGQAGQTLYYGNSPAPARTYPGYQVPQYQQPPQPFSYPAPISRGSRPNITPAFIQGGTYGRKRPRTMRPRYITIHSTQNYSSSSDAAAHARMLQRGALTSSGNSVGYLTWHFSVDERSIYQSLPENEQGQHADYEGPGNRLSIGIEMCENKGNSRTRTLDRTAQLTAYLLRKHGIPLANVVPHQHWRRIRFSDGRDMGHKNCPHFLLENGRPGAKWASFLGQVRSYM